MTFERVMHDRPRFLKECFVNYSRYERKCIPGLRIDSPSVFEKVGCSALICLTGMMISLAAGLRLRFLHSFVTCPVSCWTAHSSPQSDCVKSSINGSEYDG